MLMPKKVKYRKQQRGRMRGKAWRGGELSFGDYGLKAMEPAWISDRQIEASRVAMTRFKQVQGFAWVQEEPENMGAWTFIRPRLEAFLRKPLTYIGRRESPTPATGFPHIYRREQADIIDRAIGPQLKKRDAQSKADATPNPD